MIITITGKPCSGKGTVSKLFCEKYNFDYLCVGDMMRQIAHDNGLTILEFQQHFKDLERVDNMLDSRTAKIGKVRAKDNLVIDSRLAWHFVPVSFKVFIDVDFDKAAERLLSANREHEFAKTHEEAKEKLQNRWDVENERYQRIYGFSNMNLEQYDLVISSSNKTPEQIVEQIFIEYNKFLNK